MNKKFSDYLPSKKTIHDNRYLKPFRHLLFAPNLWHLNRRSVASAVSIGLFVCFMPVPGHMIIVSFMAIIVQANLPLSIGLVWINNPFTIAPMFIFAYELGAHLLHIPPEKFHLEMSTHWLAHEFVHYYDPLLLGCMICGSVLALFGNVLVRLYWRYRLVAAWKRRAFKRQLTAKHKGK